MTKARDLANSAAAFASVSATELGYVDGVTSAIQTQIDAKAPSSTAVTLTGTQTLTNKTLTNPVIASVVNNTLTTAKGDIVTATAASTPARLAVGNDGEQIVADSATSTGLRYNANYAAGKNAIINGAFDNWQRGTSFSNPASGSYNSDRFSILFDGTGATRTISRQTFTPGTAPVAGYEGQYFYRYAQTVAGTSNTYNIIQHKIENVQTFAGQSVVLSFWAKADSARSITCTTNQNFGSGGSADVDTNFTGTASVTTSYQRFSFTITVPSISGKTIGASSYLNIRIYLPAGTTPTIDIWGVQLEAGSVATAFQTATGTLQGELAACQRYYFRNFPGASDRTFAAGFWWRTTSPQFHLQYPVEMRTAPTLAYSGTAGVQGNQNKAITSTDGTWLGKMSGLVSLNASSATATAGDGSLWVSNGANDYIELSAEL